MRESTSFQFSVFSFQENAPSLKASPSGMRQLTAGETERATHNLYLRHQARIDCLPALSVKTFGFASSPEGRAFRRLCILSRKLNTENFPFPHPPLRGPPPPVGDGGRLPTFERFGGCAITRLRTIPEASPSGMRQLTAGETERATHNLYLRHQARIDCLPALSDKTFGFASSPGGRAFRRCAFSPEN